MTTPEPSRATCLALDEQDPLASYRDEFAIEDDSLVYFDGNSLGRLPKATIARVDQVLREEWGNRLIRSWRACWASAPAGTGCRLSGSWAGWIGAWAAQRPIQP